MTTWQIKAWKEGRVLLKISPFIIIGALAIIFEYPPLIEHSAAADEGMKPDSNEVAASMDFRACTKLAISQSPYLTKSSIDIDISRLNKRESLGSFIPSVTVRTIQYLEQEDIYGNERPMLVTFSTGAYNPLKPFLSLKASRLVTQIAILMHLQVISGGIYGLAQKFLGLDTLHKLKACQDKLAGLARQKLTFLQRLHDTGTVALLDVRIAAKELELAKARSAKIASSQSSVREFLRPFLGLEPGQRLHLNLRETRCQVLSHFDPATARLEQARTHSFELKIQELKKKIQHFNIYLAYSKFLPTVSFGVRDVDAFDSFEKEEDEDYYVNIAVSFNLWNGFKEVNDVSRQKMILRRYKAEKRLKEEKVDTGWQAAKRELHEAEVALKLARSGEELARLKERQIEIRYDSNAELLPALLGSRIAHLNVQKEVLLKTRDHDLSVLKIRHLSGDLFNTYVDEASWKE